METLTRLPLFPLPEYYLLPGVLAPLHIFEPRYRQMIEDLLDRPGRLVIAAYHPEAGQNRHGPEVAPVGSLAEIVHHEKTADGRYLIMVLGLARVAMTELEGDRPYRQVDARILDEDEPDPEREEALKERLVAALVQRTSGKFDTAEVGEAGTVGRLSDLLLSALPLEAERLARAYEEIDTAARAELALAWHQESAGPVGGE